MSNIYKESIQQVKFSNDFDKKTIAMMSEVIRKQPKKKLKFVYTAAAAVLVTAVLIFGVHTIINKQQPTYHSEVNTAPSNHQIDECSQKTSTPSEPTMLLTAQESIIKSKEFGVVSLSTRSVDEIEDIAKLAGVMDVSSEEVNCYEDETYIYFFYEDGRVAGIMASYMIDNPSEGDPAVNKNWVRLSEDEAITLAKSTLLKYCESYTEDTAERFTIEASGEKSNVPHHPDWRITFTEHTASGILRNVVTVDIDMFGNVATVFFGLRSDISDHELENREYITVERATSIALEQLRIEGREVDLEHFTVDANMVEHEGSVAWVLVFKEIEDADGEYMHGWRQVYWVVLDASTGDWIRTDFSR